MSEQEQGQQIMQRVNEATPGKIARIKADAIRYTGQMPTVVNIRQIAPALDMTVGFESELAAYKYAYMFRDHSTSRVRVEEAGGRPGTFLVVILPR